MWRIAHRPLSTNVDNRNMQKIEKLKKLIKNVSLPCWTKSRVICLKNSNKETLNKNEFYIQVSNDFFLLIFSGKLWRILENKRKRRYFGNLWLVTYFVDNQISNSPFTRQNVWISREYLRHSTASSSLLHSQITMSKEHLVLVV